MKPHLYFKNPQEGLTEYKQRPGGGDNKDKEQKKEPDYELMANQFEQSKQQFFQSQTARHQNRSLEIPVHFDLIEIDFQGCFDQQGFEQAYYFINLPFICNYSSVTRAYEKAVLINSLSDKNILDILKNVKNLQKFSWN